MSGGSNINSQSLEDAQEKLAKLQIRKVLAQLTNPVTNSLTKLDFQVNLDVDVDLFPQIMRCLKIAHRESSPAPQFLNNFLLAEPEPRQKDFIAEV